MEFPEIGLAADLMRGILERRPPRTEPARPAAPDRDRPPTREPPLARPPVQARRPPPARPPPAHPLAVRLVQAAPPPDEAPAEADAPAPELEAPEAGTRQARLEGILAALCRRPGVRGALVADSGGLAMASHGGPFPAERLAAFTTILGSALDGAGRILDSRAADRISLRLSEAETALLTRFPSEGQLFHLVVVCAPASADRLDCGPAAAALQRALVGPAEGAALGAAAP